MKPSGVLVQHMEATDTVVDIPKGSGSVLRIDLPWASGMIAQRQMALTFHGRARPGAELVWILSEQSQLDQGSCIVDANGTWQANLAPQDPRGACELRIRSDGEELVLVDILFGEVWLCSGQSNMVLPLQRVRQTCQDAIKAGSGALVRCFKVPDRTAFSGDAEIIESGRWTSLGEDTMAETSALAWFFARYLYEGLGHPVGIVVLAVGGSPIDAFLPRGALEAFPESLARLRPFEDPSWRDAVLAADEQRVAEWEARSIKLDAGLANSDLPWYAPSLADTEWDLTFLPSSWPPEGPSPGPGIFWFRRGVVLPQSIGQTGATLHLGTLIDADTVWVNGYKLGSTAYRYPPRRYRIPPGVLHGGTNQLTIRLQVNGNEGGATQGKNWQLVPDSGRAVPLAGWWYFRQGAAMEPLEERHFLNRVPSGLYHGMVAPVLNYGFKGVIWYQGESDSDMPQGYRQRLETLMATWRKSLGFPIPFLIMQLVNYGEPVFPSLEVRSNWASIRQAQLECSAQDATDLAVGIDQGEWNDLHPENKVVLGHRLALLARRLAYHEKLIVGGPRLKVWQRQGDLIRLIFSDAHGGLQVRGPGPYGNPEGNAMIGCFLAGPDGVFYEVQGQVQDDTMVLVDARISEAVELRYAWADNPVGCLLWNGAGWPASPFRLLLEGAGGLGW